MKIVLITGSCGLIGSESVSYFSKSFDMIIGIDNDMRSYYFGNNASVKWNRERISEEYDTYQHFNVDHNDYCPEGAIV